jgi:hypothetical protein
MSDLTDIVPTRHRLTLPLPLSYVDMGALVFRVPQNPTWREKVSYKGKTKSMREKRKINARTLPRDAYDYRFHSFFIRTSMRQ